MHRLLIRFLSCLLLFFLRLRYKIEVRGLEKFSESEKGILFLPNHPASIDPVILSVILTSTFHPRPLVVEHYFHLKGARFFMRLLRALPIPDMELSANQWKIKQVEKCIVEIKKGLDQGENFLIYPSGHLKTEGKEVVGGSSFIYRLLQAHPHFQIVLIRTSGLWGSSFSRVITGKLPNFWAILSKGIKVILKNGIFFLPKRKIYIEVERIGGDFPKEGSKVEINRYLENWYNHYLDDKGKRAFSEPIKLVSFSLFREELPLIIKEERKKEEKEKLEVPQKMKEDLYLELARMSGRKIEEIHDEMDLAQELGLDSLDLASLRAFLDQHYELPSIQLFDLKTVGDLFTAVLKEKENPLAIDLSYKNAYQWPKESYRPPAFFPKSKTISEAFLEICDRMGKRVACADGITGMLTYKKLKIGALVLAKQFVKLEGEYIGVILPSSITTYLIVFALLLAGKIPVLLNWTAGARSLNFAKKLLDLTHVITARRFLDKVEILDLGELEESLLFLEELKLNLTLLDKWRGFFLAQKGAKALGKHLKLSERKEEETAIVLFTSGTETYPKGVPLSHKNILSNQKGAFDIADLTQKDIFYGVLPAFHSFGLSITGILPILVGVRVFYSPNPTNTHQMARDISQREVTILCLAPSFYRNLFRIATPRQLKNVRLFVSGAEKASSELFTYVERLGKGKKMIEGYGITECSPVVTLCPLNEPQVGVGKPLPGVELMIIDPQTEGECKQGEQGEICISGENVFQGYLGEHVANPFIDRKGKRWYRSGDLGFVDKEGNLILGGRMKRFVKIGGEMVSLSAIEEELAAAAKEKGWISKEDQRPPLAIGVIEKEKPQLILFAIFSISKEEINLILREKGFPQLVKIAEVQTIPEIPLTATGKVQYRQVMELALSRAKGMQKQ